MTYKQRGHSELLYLLLVVPFLLFFGASLGLAQRLTDKPTNKQRTKAASLEQYDVNHDGVLDVQEKAMQRRDQDAFMEQMRTKMEADKAATLKQYDANQNGILDPEEKEKQEQDQKERLRQIKEKLTPGGEANKDTVLAPKGAKESRSISEPATLVQGRALQKYDLDKNGRLDPTERQQMRTERREWLQQMKQKVLDKYDVNKNGSLDPEEEKAMQADTQR